MTGVSSSQQQEATSSSLLSHTLVYRLTILAVVLAGLTGAIGLAGRFIGKDLSLGGHSASTEIQHLFIGDDHLGIPANMIRFEAQRRTGVTERVDIYLTWPSLEGYSTKNRNIFNDISDPTRLIFLQLSQSTMSRDMSGRLVPIYRHLFDGAPSPGPGGLVRHAMRQGSGYGQDVIFTGKRAGREDYVVRCLVPEKHELSTSADCQRDIHAGGDLLVLYRFSSRLLPQWQAMDDAVAGFVERLRLRSTDF